MGKIFHFPQVKNSALQRHRAVVLFENGLDAEDKGDMIEAEKFYEKSLLCDGTYIQSLNNLGTIKYDKKMYQEAEFYYRKALEIDPYYQLALYNLGTVLSEQERLGEAITCYLKVLSMNPLYHDARFNLALLYGEIADFQREKAHWEILVKSAGSADTKAYARHRINFLKEKYGLSKVENKETKQES